jgi:glycoside/pentoside/hexuronide:cation symporter, GPH family
MSASPRSRVSLASKASFGLGSGAEMISLTLIGSYAMFFYNQVTGMPATLAGLAVTVSIVADGVVDPVIGSLSDRTRSRLGRRHPWMYAAPIPIGLSIFALFNPPDLPISALFWWFLVSLVSLRVFMSVYHTPHLALGSEMSSDYAERSRIMSWNSLMGLAGGSTATFIALSIFFRATPEHPRGLLNPEAYPPFSLTLAVVATALLFASAWLTRGFIPHLPKPPAELPKFTPFEFLKDLGGALSNRNYMFLLLGMFFISLMVGLRHALGIYVDTYYWELPSELLRWYVIGKVGGTLVAFFLAARIHQRFSKRAGIVGAGVFSTFAPSAATSLSLLGLFPKPGDDLLLPLLITFDGLHAIGTALITISIMSALADIADQNEVRLGRRQEGVLYSTRTLFAKVDTAIGQLIAGVTLDLMAFPEKAAPGSVPRDTLVGLAIVYGPCTIIPGLVALMFYSRYAIDKATFDANRAAIAEMHAGRAAPAMPSPLPDLPTSPEMGELKPT